MAPGTRGEWRRVAGRKESARAPSGHACWLCSRARPPPSLGRARCTPGPWHGGTSCPRHCSLRQERVRNTPAPGALLPRRPKELPSWPARLVPARPRALSACSPALVFTMGCHLLFGGKHQSGPGGPKRPGCELELRAGPPARPGRPRGTQTADLPPTAPRAENLDLGPSASRSSLPRPEPAGP